MKAKKTILTGALISILAISSFSSAFAASSVDANPDSTDANIIIDDSIQGYDRDVILNVMRTLDLDARDNVTYVDAKGKVYANKPELLKSVIKLKDVGNNLYETPDGSEKFAVPNSDDPQAKDNPQGQQTLETAQNSVNTDTQSSCTTNQTMQTDAAILTATQPSCTSSTGPYRRVTSLANYSWESAYAHLPGGSEISDHNDTSAPGYNGDTGYVYMGGWGQNSGSVDAGLMHSTRYDNWAPLFNIAGSGVYTYTDRFASNQDVNIKFKIPSDNNISLTVSGIPYGGGTTTTLTYVHAATGFVYNGTNILKRITSIGQSSQNLSSGSWIHNVHWYNSLIGISSTNNHTWLAADTYGYCS